MDQLAEGAPERQRRNSSHSSDSSAGPGPTAQDERLDRMLDVMEAQTELMHRYLQKLECPATQESDKRQVLNDFYTSSSYNTTVVSAALIVTCCFTALLQPPGGTASTLELRAAFKVFFVLNGMAMGTSAVTILLLMGGRPETARGANILLLLGRTLMSFAIHFTLGAFLAGAFLVTAKVSLLVPVFVLCGVVVSMYYVIYCCNQSGLPLSTLPPLLERNLSSKFMISMGRRVRSSES